MPKAKSNYPELDEIREDLNSLRSNVVELTKHMGHDGNERSKQLWSQLQDRMHDLAESGQIEYKAVEKQIKDKPAKSVAVAFAAGLVTSLLLRRGS